MPITCASKMREVAVSCAMEWCNTWQCLQSECLIKQGAPWGVATPRLWAEWAAAHERAACAATINPLQLAHDVCMHLSTKHGWQLYCVCGAVTRGHFSPNIGIAQLGRTTVHGPWSAQGIATMGGSQLVACCVLPGHLLYSCTRNGGVDVSPQALTTHVYGQQCRL